MSHRIMMTIIIIIIHQVGFSVPVWMIEKMRAYIETAKTNPDTTDEELLRMAEEYAEMETDTAEAVKTKKVNIQRAFVPLIMK